MKQGTWVLIATMDSGLCYLHQRVCVTRRTRGRPLLRTTHAAGQVGQRTHFQSSWSSSVLPAREYTHQQSLSENQHFLKVQFEKWGDYNLEFDGLLHFVLYFYQFGWVFWLLITYAITWQFDFSVGPWGVVESHTCRPKPQSLPSISAMIFVESLNPSVTALPSAKGKLFDLKWCLWVINQTVYAENALCTICTKNKLIFKNYLFNIWKL